MNLSARPIVGRIIIQSSARLYASSSQKPIDPSVVSKPLVKKTGTDAESLAAKYLEMPGSSSPASLAPGTERRQSASTRQTITSTQRARRRWARSAFGLVVLSGGYLLWTCGDEFTTDYEKMRLGKKVQEYLDTATAEELGHVPAWRQRWARTRIRVSDTLDYFNKPAWEPLIPAPLPPTHQRPYTLVIELDDILIHSEWSRDHGWRTAKRPGVLDFLGYLSQFYEIVVFTEAPSYTAMPILDKMDPLQYYFAYRLYRDSTCHFDGSLVKDLSYLGRDLSKVIQIDTSADAVKTQPENAILIQPWKGDRVDDSLMAYIPFLEAIGINGVKDVRPVLKAYEGKEIPTEFAKRQLELKQQHETEWRQKHQSVSSGFAPGKIFGLSTASKDNSPPPTFYEAERQRYMDHYKQERQFISDNESKLLGQMEADRDRQMKEMKTSFFGFMSNLGQPQPPPSQSS